MKDVVVEESRNMTSVQQFRAVIVSDQSVYKYLDHTYIPSAIDRVGYKKDEEGLEGDGMEEVDLGKPSLVITNPNV